MTPLIRITLDPDVRGGKPCIHDMRITVGIVSCSHFALDTGGPMVRAFACFLLCLLASPCFSQSVYVGGTVAANTTSLNRYESDGRPDIGSAGTALVIGGRVGLALGTRWGAEVEFSNGFEITKENRTGGMFGPTSVFSLSIGSGGQYEFITHARQRNRTLSPILWLSHPLRDRVDLVLVTGASFDRMITDERYEIVISPPLFGVLDVGFGPNSVHVVQYHVGVLDGVETRLAVGEHLRLVPSLRIHGWSGWRLGDAANCCLAALGASRS
jgi:hypothetical protein